MTYLCNQVGEQQWKNMEPNEYFASGGSHDPELINFPVIPGMLVYGFGNNNAMHEMFCTFEIPHEYKAGTDLRPHVHWVSDTSGTGNVLWQITYSIGDDDLAFTEATTISAVCPVKAPNLYNSCEFSPVISGVISGYRVQPGAIIAARLFRDSAASGDTYEGVAKLLTLGVHYQTDKLGTTTVFANEGDM